MNIDTYLHPEICCCADELILVHRTMLLRGYESYQLGPYTTNDVVDELRREVEELREWKRQQMLVESQWDEQEVGRQLGMTIGTSIRKNIKQGILNLKEELAETGKDYACLAHELDGHDATECLMNLRRLKEDAWKYQDLCT